MKRIILLTALLCLALAGCVEDIGPAKPGDGPLLVGDFVEVEAPAGFAPMEYNDVLAADGIYYATWSLGEARPFTNEDGGDAEIFDAQIYLLLSEKTSPENARAEADELLELAKSRYQVDSITEETYDGQRYTILTYRYASDTNPYATGAAAYGVRGSHVLNVEVSALEGGEDPLTPLGDILYKCRYMDEEEN